MSEINWSTELRKIEREYDGLPPARTRTQIRLQKVQEIIAKGRFDEQLAVVGLWARLFLVAALGTSLFWWPYGRECGFGLAAFLVSQSMVIAGGISVAAFTWRTRQIWPFGGSAFFIVVAWTVIALNTVPRLGYPTVPASTASAGWACPATR